MKRTNRRTSWRRTRRSFTVRQEPLPQTYDDRPIGVFDSGYGGMTVARELIETLPHESLIYLGDSARCPYGDRPLAEVREFVVQICRQMVEWGVKLIVIGYNTATAAGLMVAQRIFPVPIVGVVEPGARAAVQVTHNRRVGVIATRGTIESGAYSDAIRHIDAGITVFSTPAPRFVEIAEQGLKLAQGPLENYLSSVSSVYVRSEFQGIAREYLEPLRRVSIDTLVLGCTHYPLLTPLISSVMGHEVTLISSAKETARDVREILGRKGAFARPTSKSTYRFYTTGENVEEYQHFGSYVLNRSLDNVEHWDLEPKDPLIVSGP